MGLGAKAVLGGILAAFIAVLWFLEDREFLELRKRHDDLPDPGGRTDIALRIWQIYFDKEQPIEVELHRNLVKWKRMNPEYRHRLLDDGKASLLLSEVYPNRPEVLQVFQSLRSRVVRADFLRYALLATEGGVYSDLDTIPLQPISEWIPARHRGSVSAIVGIEYDKREDEWWPGMFLPIQFCQWTLAASRDNLLFQMMLNSTLGKLQIWLETREPADARTDPSDTEIVKMTGPVAWTEVVFQYLSATLGREVTWKDITGLESPELFGNVLLLPINSFATGQKHSGSVFAGDSPDALLLHTFRGFWKQNWVPS